MPDYELEQLCTDRGYKLVCGVDEAGRGPLSGPVFAAAVILPAGLYIEGLNDSKKLTPKKRDALFDTICREAVTYGIASMELLVLFLQYHNAWYRGEDKEAIWEKIEAACDDAVCRYTPIVYPGAEVIELEQRDILERAQLKKIYYTVLKNRL